MSESGLANGWPLSYGRSLNTSLQNGWQHQSFPFHLINMLCYRSLTTRFITRSKPDSDHTSNNDYTLRNRWTHDIWKERVETCGSYLHGQLFVAPAVWTGDSQRVTRVSKVQSIERNPTYRIKCPKTRRILRTCEGSGNPHAKDNRTKRSILHQVITSMKKKKKKKKSC